MEWVETTGTTVEEAKERALDQLGVLAEDAEFEVLEEPKQGLFGRVRGEARVRARVRPTQARQKIDRRDRRKGDKAAKGDRVEKAEKGDKGDTSASTGEKDRPRGGREQGRQAAPKQRQQRASSAATGETTSTTPAPRQAAKETVQVDARQVGLEAQKFLEGLVASFGLSGTVQLAEDGDDLELRVHGDELGLLVGPRGTTLQAVQDLARVASQRRLGDHDTRLRVDIGGYRERRAAALSAFALKMADEVASSGVARVLEPMSSPDRKVIHDTLASVEGIETRSEGDDPHRRVVIAPANG